MSTSTALTIQQQNQLALKSFFEGPKFREELKQALPAHVKPDRFVRVALTAINQNPRILECSQQSIGLSMLKAAASGLDVGRECHLIPYGKEVQFQVDYKGIATMLRRSGEVADVHSDIVCEGDEFSYCYGTGSHLKHKPARHDRGRVTEVYSYVRFKDGSESFEVMSVEDVNYVRDTFSQGYKNAKANNRDHPWVSSWEAMACKTVFKKHSKWLPLSAELIEALGNDEDDTKPTGFDSARQVNERPAMPEKAKGVAAMRQAETPASESAKPAEVVGEPMTVGEAPAQSDEIPGDPAPAAAAPAPAPATPPAEPAATKTPRRPRSPAKPAEQTPIDVPSTPVSTQTETTHATPAPAQPSQAPATEAAGGSAAPAAPAASAPKESTPQPEWPKTITTTPVDIVDYPTANLQLGYRQAMLDGKQVSYLKKVEIDHPVFKGIAYFLGKDVSKLSVTTKATFTLKQQPSTVPDRPPTTIIESIRTESDLF